MAQGYQEPAGQGEKTAAAEAGGYAPQAEAAPFPGFSDPDKYSANHDYSLMIMRYTPSPVACANRADGYPESQKFNSTE
jgi:hypothetical protein